MGHTRISRQRTSSQAPAPPARPVQAVQAVPAPGRPVAGARSAGSARPASPDTAAPSPAAGLERAARLGHEPGTAGLAQRAPLKTAPPDELKKKPAVQRDASFAGAQGGPLTGDVERSIDGARSGGKSLDAGVRASMEPAFGADFGGVRVHADSKADALNRSLQARAFTTGRDIFFRRGEYNPASAGGKEILAHELTHVVQQNGAAQLHRKPATGGLALDPYLAIREDARTAPRRDPATAVPQSEPPREAAADTATADVPSGRTS